MITEADLTRLLAEAAESAPPPGPAPDALLAALDEGDSTSVPRPRFGRSADRPVGRRLVAVAAAVLLVVFAVGVLTSADDDGDVRQTAADTFGEERAGDAATGAMPTTTMAVGGGGAGAIGTTGGDGGAAQTEDSDRSRLDASTQPLAPESGGLVSPPGAVGQPALSDSAKVVKTGSIDLEVGEGSFTRSVELIISKVVGLNGYIAEQTTSQSSDSPSGSIVVRVPEASFEDLLTELRKLGEVQAVTSKGTDVSAQYTDVVARLTALAATRDRLSTVLSEADNVTDILMVQDRITAVQTEIETYQGQLRLLDDQTSMATLSVTLAEPGAEPVQIGFGEDDDGGIGGAWDDARRRFGDGIEALVGWSGVAGLLVLLGIAALVVARGIWPRLRRRLL